jgi:hypothetical protein
MEGLVGHGVNYPSNQGGFIIIINQSGLRQPRWVTPGCAVASQFRSGCMMHRMSTPKQQAMCCSSTHLTRTARARGSQLDSPTSSTCRRVGSAFAPAPALLSTRIPLLTQAAIRSTCVGDQSSKRQLTFLAAVQRMLAQRSSAFGSSDCNMS